MLLGNLAGDGFHLARAHVVGGRIDHIAGQRAGVGDLSDFSSVGALGDQSGLLCARCLVAVEPIAPQGEMERDLVGGDAVRPGGDPVDAGRQLRR